MGESNEGKARRRLPQLTPEQRAANLEKAGRVRKARAAILREVSAGTRDFAGLMAAADADPRVAGRIRVARALTAFPGIGDARAARIMRELHIADGRRLAGLGSRQRERLAGIVAERARAPRGR